MSSEKMQLMGMREKLRQENIAICLEGKSCFEAIKDILSRNIPFALEKINSSILEHHAQRLHDAHEKQKKILADIAEIEKELE